MKTKYHRTFHLPYSLTIGSDDKRLADDSQFLGMEVVVLEKMDGENTNIYGDGTCHARSLDGYGKPWQTWMLKDAQRWAFDIPDGWRVCGECLYAEHSIPYTFTDEKDYFQVFNIWNGSKAISWDETETWCNLLGIKHVPVIYRGVYDKDAILKAFDAHKANSKNDVEGFVVRNADGFEYDDFGLNVAKFVRENHVTTDEHWTKNWKKNVVNR